MKKEPNFFEKLSVLIIVEVHQKKISPKLNKAGSKCRFYPTCSNYGLLALEKYGFFKGWFKTVSRIWRCKPTNKNSCVDYP